MKKIFLFFLIFLFLYNNSYYQELYINTEAASLIPKGTKVIRFNYSNIFLNQTNAAGDAPTTWNDTDPTSSVFTLGTTSLVNADGDNFIAYLWSNIQGFSKIGKYIGNGNSN